MGRRTILWAGSALAASYVFCATAANAGDSNFYAGKTVRIVVSTAAGGGYDALARAVAAHLSAHIPGGPTIVVQDMPGAGGIVSMNYLYNAAPKDGTVIGALENNTPFEPLFGTKEVKFDATKFNWLGTPSSEVDVLTVWRNGHKLTLDGLKKHELTIGSTGSNSYPSIWSNVLSQTLGLKLRPIVGYPGQKSVLLGMERGEVGGTFVFYQSLMATRPAWVKNKKVKMLLQMGGQKEPEIASVPFATDLAKSKEDKLLIEEAAAPLSIGRPYVMPPGVPADRVAIMRKAIVATFKDPAFNAEIEKMKMKANAVRTGAQIQAIIERTYRTPSQVAARMRKLVNP